MLPIFQIESFISLIVIMGFPGSARGKVYLPASAEDIKDTGLTPELERSPGGGHGSPFQYACLENPMDRGAWWATVHGVAKSHTRLKQLQFSSVQSLSRVRLFATLQTVARKAPLSMGLSRQKYWNGLPCPPPENLPNPGIKLESLVSSSLTGRFFTTRATWEVHAQLTRDCELPEDDGGAPNGQDEV